MLFINIFPLLGSKSLGIMLIIVVFPDPEAPTNALSLPPFNSHEKFSKTFSIVKFKREGGFSAALH